MSEDKEINKIKSENKKIVDIGVEHIQLLLKDGVNGPNSYTYHTARQDPHIEML